MWLPHVNCNNNNNNTKIWIYYTAITIGGHGRWNLSCWKLTKEQKKKKSVMRSAHAEHAKVGLKKQSDRHIKQNCGAHIHGRYFYALNQKFKNRLKYSLYWCTYLTTYNYVSQFFHYTLQSILFSLSVYSSIKGTSTSLLMLIFFHPIWLEWFPRGLEA